MKKWYYLIFLGCLFCFNQAFQEYVELYGLLQGIFIGLLIALLCKIAFNVVTKTIIFIAILAGFLVFLVSSGYLTVPEEFVNLVNLSQIFHHFF